LTVEETSLLWWPSDSHKLLNRLEALGGFDKAFISTSSVNILIPLPNPGDFSTLNIHSTDNMPIFDRVPGNTSSSFDLITTGEVAKKFDVWFQRARVIHAWNEITQEILDYIMASSASWGQIRKAFPEMYDLLADADTGDHESWRYGTSDARVVALLKYFKNQGHAGAHDKLPGDLKATIRSRKGPMIEVMKQALSLSSIIAMSGVLDASPFKKTWFI